MDTAKFLSNNKTYQVHFCQILKVKGLKETTKSFLYYRNLYGGIFLLPKVFEKQIKKILIKCFL